MRNVVSSISDATIFLWSAQFLIETMDVHFLLAFIGHAVKAILDHEIDKLLSPTIFWYGFVCNNNSDF